MLEGRMAVFLFDDQGTVERSIVIGGGSEMTRGVDLPPGLWHTVAALTQHAICYEVKPGPWNPGTDKEFAAWAPEEGSPEAADYLSRLVAPLGLLDLRAQ
jgi:cupin fold WbuC family metalloprotein